MRSKASRVSLAVDRAHRAVVAVFIACSMSSTSLPRASPTMMRSGRIRRAFLQQIALRDFASAFIVRRPGFHRHHVPLLQLQFGRLLDGDDPFGFGNDRLMLFSIVVLPAPVPPLTTMFIRPCTQAMRKSAISG